MNIVILNGSPRKNGATAKILHALESELSSKDNAYIEFINISDMDIKPCNGCMGCYRTGSCAIKDDAEGLSAKIGTADGVIIGSPTYASNVSGQLKTFIDRGHFVIEQLLHDKYAVCVATGVNYGNRDAAKILGKLLKYSGAQVSGQIVCNVPSGSEPCDDHMRRRIRMTSAALYKDIKNKRIHIVQKNVHKIIFGLGIKPFVLRQGESYNGVIEKWEKSGISK